MTRPISVVSKGWQRLATGDAGTPNGTPNGRVDRKAYSLGVLEALQDALKRRDVYVYPSERYADPRAKLLSGAARGKRPDPAFCVPLELPASPEEYLKELGERLDEAYRRTADNLPENADVTINKEAKGKDSLDISRLGRAGGAGLPDKSQGYSRPDAAAGGPAGVAP